MWKDDRRGDDLYLDLSRDSDQANLRGCAVLGTFMLCVALYTGGLSFPLVEVVIFPGSSGLETRLVKSVMNMIGLAFENNQHLVGIIMLVCTVGIPMVLFIGMLVIMYENFFAIGFGWNTCFRPSVRALVVSLMYISTSYQVVMIFLVMLFTCFFSGFASETYLRCGFHFLFAYCLISIGLVQAMDFLRVEADDETDGAEKAVSLESVNSFNLRRSLSSFIPSLPGIKETTSVDAFQVFFFQILFLTLLVMGFEQPLLDVQVMYQGVALERRILSLHDMTVSLASSAPFPVVLLFVVLVVVIPVVYGCVLVAAGTLDVYLRCCGTQQGMVYNWILWVAKTLRPWVMIDVFSIAVIIVLYAVHNEYVSATIPDGVAPSLASSAATSEEHWLHFFSGMYLIVGAGMAAIFLRWFWSSTAGVIRKKPGSELTEMKRMELYQHVPMVSQQSRSDSRSSNLDLDEGFPYEESIVTRYVAGKSCRCLVLWTAICLVLHGLPPPQHEIKLASMNQALRNGLPLLNKLLVQYSPQTIGNCKYPAQGIPQPCYEFGILHKEVDDVHRVTAEWMTGLKTLTLTDISITKTQTLAMQGSPTILHRFVLRLKGVIADPKLFLRIEECPKDDETLKAITGKGLCRPFLDTAQSCCEPHRTFEIDIGADCVLGDSALGNARVGNMRLDTMTVKPEMWKRQGQVHLVIADKNITSMVLASVKENIMWYLTQQPMLKIGVQSINTIDFLNKVLRFNAAHEEFHCR